MYPPYTLPFAKMYINNSGNLTPGVNQFPHVSSAETETHNHFCPKSAQPFDLPGFSRQKNNCLHMHSRREHIHAAYLLHLIPPRLQHLKVSRQAGRFAGDIHHLRHTVADDFLQGFRMDAVTRRIEHDIVRLLLDLINYLEHVSRDKLAVCKTV